MKVLLLSFVVFQLCTVFVECFRQPSQVSCSEPSFYGDACECFENRPHFQELVCRNLSCFREFSHYLKEVQGFNVRRLSMENMEIKYIPRLMFERNFTWLEVSHSVLTEELFEFIPQNNKIDHLLLNEVRIADGKWDWKIISPLEKLATLRMRKMSVGSLQNFTHFSKSLKHLVLHGCDVRELRVDQFREFKQLEMIDIRHDRLKELKRSMFPTPSKLRILIFRNNHLTSLPENLFEGMKDLIVIDFQQNHLTVLSERILKPVLNPVLSLQGNPLKCDCEMKWILEIKMVKGKCDAPQHLKGKEIKHLEEENFNC
ncbi:phospholipase A2 inhibitor beta [Parasteatoda tepidariorum]|uniref:phospholipase A2 inhibitor beta n=1 Tax=Parasteatoda tepidariorum TaxID=114398 RepID=UPI00077F8C7A|nr:phospholipase A2 inhibitor beta [Parasteatoda tepidariorum]